MAAVLLAILIEESILTVKEESWRRTKLLKGQERSM
jgi:hypothetical protein